MEETNQSTHPPSCPSSPPTHLINEIKPHAALLWETFRSLHRGYICCLLICHRGTVAPDYGQLLPRPNLVFHVVARTSTGAWQQNRNESAAHGFLFNSGSAVFNCEQWSEYLNVGLVGSVKFSPENKTKKNTIRSIFSNKIVLQCDIIVTFLPIVFIFVMIFICFLIYHFLSKLN